MLQERSSAFGASCLLLDARLWTKLQLARDFEDTEHFATLRREMGSRRSIGPWFKLLGVALLAALLLAYPLDWCIWQLRMLRGQGLGSVDVTQTTAATLKGNHFEVYSQQVTTVNCSRSLLPEAGAGPCWWLRRHTQLVTQY